MSEQTPTKITYQCENCDGLMTSEQTPEACPNCGLDDLKNFIVVGVQGSRGKVRGIKKRKIKSTIIDISSLPRKDESLYLVQKNVLELLARKDSDSYYKATEEIVNYVKNKYRLFSIIDDKNSEVWFYNSEKGIYEPNGESKIKKIIRDVVMTAYTAVIAKNVLDKLKADSQISLDEFIGYNYNYKYEIPCLNGILNIKTRELCEYTPDKIFFTRCNVKYNPDAKCPNTEEHFKSILKNPEDIKIMEEIYGAGLLREYKIEKACIYVGDGRNGKGKTLEHKRRFFGAENCSNIPLKSLLQESFELEDLFGKLMNISGDLSSSDLSDTSLFKMVTGRDTIMAKRKFRSAIKFINYAKMIFACNELPRVYDTSKGFWSRWVLLEFPYTFVTQEEYNKAEDKSKLKIMNPEQVEKISTPEELSGWLNRALEGFDRLELQRDYSITQGSKEIKEFWIRKSNSFMAFALDLLEPADFEYTIPKAELRNIYSKYCKLFNVKPVSDAVIKISLENEFGVTEARISIANSERELVWRGIKSKSFKSLDSEQVSLSGLSGGFDFYKKYIYNKTILKGIDTPDISKKKKLNEGLNEPLELKMPNNDIKYCGQEFRYLPNNTIQICGSLWKGERLICPVCNPNKPESIDFEELSE